MKDKPYVFVSYSRRDNQIVREIVDGLKVYGINVWLDVENLLPGQQWEVQIRKALENASGLLVFVSSASMESDFVRAELQAMVEGRSGLIIPIILEHVDNLPLSLQAYQWVDISNLREPSELQEATKQIADAILLAGPLSEQQVPLSEDSAKKAAKTIATATKEPPRLTEIEQPPESVFIVHGHDKIFLDVVEGYVKNLGIEPIVLTRIGGQAQSLFQKFLQWTSNTKFAIVLLTSDDMGASRIQYEADGVGNRALQFRARQNVILELGFFYGYLGWEQVFVLYKKPDKVFPNFERPSDLDGVIFEQVDETGKWMDYLRDQLLEAGFELR